MERNPLGHTIQETIQILNTMKNPKPVRIITDEMLKNLDYVARGHKAKYTRFCRLKKEQDAKNNTPKPTKKAKQKPVIGGTIIQFKGENIHIPEGKRFRVTKDGYTIY